jgi:hypothetical protein
LEYKTTAIISGSVRIYNHSRLELVNVNNISTTLINHTNNVSFMNNYTTPNNTTDIVISKGFRTSVTDNEVVFHKPGDTIIDNSSKIT